MTLTILSQNENPLLQRREVVVTMVFEGATPSNAQVAGELAKQFQSGTDLVVVRNIQTEFGRREIRIRAFIYANKEAWDKVKVMTAHLKKKAEEGKKTAGEAVLSKKESGKKEE